ncbi:hypothetical protein V1520DRAFT_339899 [Lipomyces starkeyi]|uniref:Uncharacterized protein n=1 Tax=Lipomyces starkeyi NRRL Y-11557 TaxID=675824 RepID=A0A1E3Q572_LIPST|nr:hypothetical protein LIPSTDRAFT_4483 [Lipomyces starkeyi NRRL Y-11557]
MANANTETEVARWRGLDSRQLSPRAVSSKDNSREAVLHTQLNQKQEIFEGTTSTANGESLFVDTLIIGNGPSALVLSYLLHGNTPFYDPNTEYGPHPDSVLHSLLDELCGKDKFARQHDSHCIYDSILHNLTLQQYLRYTQRASAPQVVAPVNYLLDTLVAPNIDIDIHARQKSRVRWILKKEHAVDHLVVGSSFVPGGQWAGRDVPSKTLSYAEMLSLPGFSYSEYYKSTHGKEPDPYSRPMRTDVAAYYALYPSRVEIGDAVRVNYTVLSLHRSEGRTGNTFKAIIQNNDTACLQIVTARNVVLATGVFTHQVPPDPILYPIVSRQLASNHYEQTKVDIDGAVLIIGSGFSAADAILSVPDNKKIIHLFQWDPKNRPSPLRACHKETYPEYASLYRLMRLAAASRGSSSNCGSSYGLAGRYEGFANGSIIEATTDTINILLSSGATIERRVSELKTYVGRIGVISYLSSKLRAEVGFGADQIWASKNSFRKRINSRMEHWTAVGTTQASRDSEKHVKEGYYIQKWTHEIGELACKVPDFENCKVYINDYATSYGLEVAGDVFVIGSLVGDSLVRYILGGCVAVAGNIIERRNARRRIN